MAWSTSAALFALLHPLQARDCLHTASRAPLRVAGLTGRQLWPENGSASPGGRGRGQRGLLRAGALERRACGSAHGEASVPLTTASRLPCAAAQRTLVVVTGPLRASSWGHARLTSRGGRDGRRRRGGRLARPLDRVARVEQQVRLRPTGTGSSATPRLSLLSHPRPTPPGTARPAASPDTPIRPAPTGRLLAASPTSLPLPGAWRAPAPGARPRRT